MSFNGEQFENLKPRKPRNPIIFEEQNKRTTKICRQKLNMNHVARKKLTEAKMKKSIQKETVRTLQDQN